MNVVTNGNSKPDLAAELADLRLRLAEAEETLEAIRHGEADGFVIAGPQGPQVFTLQGAQEPYRLLIEQMSEGALTLSRDGVILYANQAFVAMLRLLPGRVIGTALRDFLPAAEQPALAGLIEKAWNGSSSGEVTICAAGGSAVRLRLGLHRLQLGAETLVCAVATDITLAKQRESEFGRLAELLETRVAERTGDLAASRVVVLNMMEEAVEGRKAVEEANRGLLLEISERQRAEAEVHRLNAELEQRVQNRTAELQAANHELEAFSYSVSHDLRAPLRHVQGYVEMLAHEAAGSLSENCRRYMKTIAEVSVEMGVLIDDLLAFSRMGRTEMIETNVDLNALVQDTLRDLEPVTRARRIIWGIPSLPAVQADPAMLKLLLANLLSNAIKFTRPRDPALIEMGVLEDSTPALQHSDPHQPIVLFVRDNGVGFDPQYAHKLFGVFQRLHRADEFEGTGIGLANVRRIITRHGGRTWAEGKPGAGATFYFTLRAAA